MERKKKIKIYKRISLIMACVILCLQFHPLLITLADASQYIDSEILEANYQYDCNGNIVYARITINNDIAERIGNVIYINGVKEATINDNMENELARPVLNRSGWVSTDTCPYGSSGSYTSFISSTNRNIALEKKVALYTVTALRLIIAAVVPPYATSLRIANGIVSAVINAVYSDTKTLYFTESKYGHSSFPNYYRKVYDVFYFDSAHTDYATSDIFYQWWG